LPESDADIALLLPHAEAKAAGHLNDSGKVIRGVKAKTGENGDLPPKNGRNRRSGTNRPNLSVFKILQTVPIDQNKPIMP
jgi:hypothetical protein